MTPIYYFLQITLNTRFAVGVDFSGLVKKSYKENRHFILYIGCFTLYINLFKEVNRFFNFSLF